MNTGSNKNWKNALACTIGNMLEWYDFIIFGFLSVLLTRQFFPAADRYTALLSATATFGAGFIFRPVGGLLIGMYADRKGRKNALTLVILMMMAATFILAFTPTYSSIGIWATVLVVIARILQGISAGGEFGAATSILVEYAPKKRTGFYGSWQMFAQAFGVMLSALMGSILTNSFSEATLEAWAWRIPFLFGLLIGPLGLYMRRTMTETDDFKATERVSGTLTTTIKCYGLETFIATALSAALNVMAYVLIAYLPIYAVTNLGVPVSVPFNVLVVASLIRLATVPYFGALADRIGGEVILRRALMIFIVILYPSYYWITQYPSVTSIMVTEIVFSVLMGAYAGPVSTVSAELFPVGVRATALSLSYNIGASILGGVSPVLMTWLLHTTGNKYVPAHYCIFFFIVGLCGVWLIRRVSSPLRNKSVSLTQVP